MGVIRVQLVQRHPTDGTKFRVTFSEAANDGDATTSTNYSVSGLTLTAAAVVANTGQTQYDITTSSTFTNNTLYTLVVSNVRDDAGGTPIVSGTNGTFNWIWLGTGSPGLEAVPTKAGILHQVTRLLIGDRALGSNAGSTTYLAVISASWSATTSKLRVFCGETLDNVTPTTDPARYTITPPGGAPALTVTAVTLGANYVDLTLSGTPISGTYQVTIAGSTFSGLNTGNYNLEVTKTWALETQRRRGNFNAGFG